MLSQFVSPYEHILLGGLNYDFPKGTQAVGRLDEDSEGLLLLTNDKSLTGRLLHPEKKHRRKYIVQVRRKVEPDTLKRLMEGIDILVQGKGLYKTQPCEVKIIDKPKHLPERANTMKEFIPHSWLEFTLEEGKKRQIRKMCKAVRHDCRRLIRTSIEDLELGNMEPGEVKEIEEKELFTLLKIKP